MGKRGFSYFTWGFSAWSYKEWVVRALCSQELDVLSVEQRCEWRMGCNPGRWEGKSGEAAALGINVGKRAAAFNRTDRHLKNRFYSSCTEVMTPFKFSNTWKQLLVTHFFNWTTHFSTITFKRLKNPDWSPLICFNKCIFHEVHAAACSRSLAVYETCLQRSSELNTSVLQS